MNLNNGITRRGGGPRYVTEFEYELIWWNIFIKPTRNFSIVISYKKLLIHSSISQQVEQVPSYTFQFRSVFWDTLIFFSIFVDNNFNTYLQYLWKQKYKISWKILIQANLKKSYHAKLLLYLYQFDYSKNVYD